MFAELRRGNPDRDKKCGKNINMEPGEIIYVDGIE